MDIFSGNCTSKPVDLTMDGDNVYFNKMACQFNLQTMDFEKLDSGYDTSEFDKIIAVAETSLSMAQFHKIFLMFEPLYICETDKIKDIIEFMQKMEYKIKNQKVSVSDYTDTFEYHCAHGNIKKGNKNYNQEDKEEWNVLIQNYFGNDDDTKLYQHYMFKALNIFGILLNSFKHRATMIEDTLKQFEKLCQHGDDDAYKYEADYKKNSNMYLAGALLQISLVHKHLMEPVMINGMDLLGKFKISRVEDYFFSFSEKAKQDIALMVWESC